MDKTVRCPDCGARYTFYAFYAADQSVCPGCRAAAAPVVIDWTPIQRPNPKAPESPVDRLIRECGGVPPREEEV